MTIINSLLNAIPNKGNFLPFINQQGSFALLQEKAGDALASLIYCSCVSSSVKSITVLACLPDVVDYPHHLGPTTKTAPFDLSANFKVSSNSLGI